MTTLLSLLLTVTAWLAAESADRDPWDVWTIVHAAHVAGEAYGIDPALLVAVAGVESRWHPRAGCTGPHRACGAWQQIPAYSGMWSDECWDGPRLLCRQPGGAPLSAGELSGDVYLQARVAARHLSYLRDRYPTGWLAAYNRGPRRRGDAIGAAYTARVMRVHGRMR